jgi:hypothetical protein
VHKGVRNEGGGLNHGARSEAVDKGSFDLRGPIGHQWNLAKKDPEVARKYSLIGKSYASQRTFRLQWAQGEYDTMKEERVRLTTSSTSFGSFGDPMCNKS